MPADADPAHRHVVRLGTVDAFSVDDPTLPRADPLTDAPITEIAWGAEDALPFPLCVSSVTDEAHGAVFVDGVSVARGNMVLADHGHTLPADETFDAVPAPRLYYPPDRDASRCGASVPIEIPPRFRPLLAAAPLTFAGTVLKTTEIGGVKTTERLPFDPGASAAAAMQWRIDDALPAIALTGTLGTAVQDWGPRRDLLASEADDPHFVVEVEHDGSARLRFGDDASGRRPETATVFAARYRIGNGRAGNVGAGTIAHAVTIEPNVLAVRNPLAAGGRRGPGGRTQSCGGARRKRSAGRSAR